MHIDIPHISPSLFKERVVIPKEEYNQKVKEMFKTLMFMWMGPSPHIPAVTSFDNTLDASSQAPVSVPDVSTVFWGAASPVFPQPELPTLKQQPAPPQQIHIQQHLQFHFLPDR